MSRRPAFVVRGLVRLRERVRLEAGRGLRPHGLQALRHEVESTVKSLEEACARAGVTPARLPPPSRNAYRYLKTLDFARLPRGEEELKRPVGLRGLIKTHERLLERLDAGESEAGKVREEARRVLGRVEALCAQGGIAPADLAGRSGTVYRALLDLCEPGVAEAHGSTLRRASDAARVVLDRLHPGRQRQLAVSLRRMPSLWRLRETSSGVVFVLSDALVGAPDEVLVSAAEWALARQARAGRAAIERWLQQRLAGRSPSGFDCRGPRGLHHDLGALFAELNHEHFAGELAPPVLSWTRTATYHRFGHYTYAEDKVVISSTLDHPDVPGSVVAYVVYHELLHKRLGVEDRGSRSCGHSAEFRALERRFPGYEDSCRFLERLAARGRR